VILPFVIQAPELQAVRLAVAEQTVDERLPLVPEPKQVVFSRRRLEIKGPMEYPAGHFMHADDFTSTLAGRFDLSGLNGAPVKIDGGLVDAHLPKNAFQIRIDAKGIHVFGQDETGLALGLRRLALIAFSEGGHLYLPFGEMIDYPSVAFRGFHLFVGPRARPFHQRLSERVLMPLGFNAAVIECEQTEWEALPNVRGGIAMPRDELRKLFAWYRAAGIEAIPLVQSFGHMAWLFKGGANLGLAVDPTVPQVIDPRKPGTPLLLEKLWDEVIALTRAKSVHFGCDEVGLKGVPAAEVTDLWKVQIPRLAEIAKKHEVQMMLWGDQMLAPEEVVDAGQAPNVAEAAARRAVLPAGTTVADWHYKDSPDSQLFLSSIDLFQRLGMKVIETSWFRPENAQSVAIAAAQRGAGVLETTWAGYESSAKNPFENFEQFASFVLTAEYAWSGRSDGLKALGYDYRDLFRRLWFEAPIRLSSRGGSCITDQPSAAEVSVGRYAFKPMRPSESAVIPSSARGKELVVFLRCDEAAKVGTTVGTMKLGLVGGEVVREPVVYGWQVRAGSDSASAGDAAYCPGAEFKDGVFAVRVAADKAVAGVRLEGAVGGLKLVGLTVLDK
jgi:hypothetical protein